MFWQPLQAISIWSRLLMVLLLAAPVVLWELYSHRKELRTLSELNFSGPVCVGRFSGMRFSGRVRVDATRLSATAANLKELGVTRILSLLHGVGSELNAKLVCGNACVPFECGDSSAAAPGSGEPAASLAAAAAITAAAMVAGGSRVSNASSTDVLGTVSTAVHSPRRV